MERAALRLELLKLVYRKDLKPKDSIELAEELERFITKDGDKSPTDGAKQVVSPPHNKGGKHNDGNLFT